MNTCEVCQGPLPPYKGKGRMPEIHSNCGEIKHSCTRLKASLERLNETSVAQRMHIRAYLMNALFSVVNLTFNRDMPRRKARSSAELLQSLIKRLERTASGRAALAEAGLSYGTDAGNGNGGHFSQEKGEVH